MNLISTLLTKLWRKFQPVFTPVQPTAPVCTDTLTVPAIVPKPLPAIAPLHPPLKVVCVHEANRGTRMVMSGHIADICDELERMIAQEALHSR